MSIDSWSRQERTQVVSAGFSPLLVSVASSGIASFVGGIPLVLVLAVLLPFGYATLFFFVMPSLLVLRRLNKESLPSFTLVCGLATLVPWWILYLVLGLAHTGKFSGAPIQAFTILAVPAVLASIAGAVVYRLGGPHSRSPQPNPSVKGTSRKRAAPYVER